MATTITPFPDIGLPCPDFRLPSVVDGKMFSLEDFKTDQPLVVVFMCNHCPYVKAVEDRLIRLGQDLKKLGIPMLAICANDETHEPEDRLENLRKRAESKNYSFPYLHDKTQEVAKSFGALCTPDYFVYDKSLKLAYRGRLDDSWKDEAKATRRELFEAAKALQEGRPAPEQQTPSMGCSIKWV
jgi:peroxiredoxin